VCSEMWDACFVVRAVVVCRGLPLLPSLSGRWAPPSRLGRCGQKEEVSWGEEFVGFAERRARVPKQRTKEKLERKRS